MLVEELASKLGLDLDVASFTKAILLAEGLTKGLEGIFEAAKEFGLELVHSVTETAEFGAHMRDLALRTGISEEALQAMEYAAKQTGGELGNFIMGAKMASLAAVAAAKGSSEQASAYRRLGIDVHGSNGKLKSGEELLTEISERMAGVTNETERTELSYRLLGRQGQALNPVLRGGESGLAELTKNFRELGVAMGPEAIAQSKEFSDRLTDLQFVLNAIKRSFGVGLIGALTNALKATIRWLVAARHFISEGLDKHFFAIKVALMGVGAIILASLLPGMFAWVASIVSTIAWYGALTIASFLAGETAVMAALLAALPWLALAAIIFLVGEDLYQFFTGGDSLIGDFLNGTWAKFIFELKDIWNTVKFYAGQFWDWLMGAAEKAVQWVIDKFLGLVDSVKGFVASMPGGKWVLEHAFGAGAESPAAQAALGGAGGPMQSNFQADITVHAPAGASPGEVATQTVAGFDDWHSGVLQDALYDSEEE